MAVKAFGGGTTPRSRQCYMMVAAILILLLLVITHPFTDESYHRSLVHHLASTSSSGQETQNESDVAQSLPPKWEPIPNLVHFTYLLPEIDSQFSFQFKNFLSMYAVWLHWHPDAIYFHTNASPEQVEAAKNGTGGKWNKLIFNMPGFIANQVSTPVLAGNGVQINLIEHKSDFARVDVVGEIGGIYIDWDAFALRDIRKIREAGFNAVVGRQPEGQIMSGTFMGVPHAKCISMWKKEMNRVFDGGWTTHSNDAIDRIARRLTREEGEVLIMEHDAFGPGSFSNIAAILYETHEDIPSNLQNITDGDPLPDHTEELTSRWDYPERYPEWERDYSNTYLLHAFNLKAHGDLTPRYMLERRSDLSRALYPVAKHMYDTGLISIDDPANSV